MIWSCPIYLTCMFLGRLHDFSFERRSKFGIFYFSQSTKYISLSLRQLRMHFLKEKYHIYIWSKLQASVKFFFSYVLPAIRISVWEICILICKCIPSVKFINLWGYCKHGMSLFSTMPHQNWQLNSYHSYERMINCNVTFKKKSFVIKGFKTCHW